MIATTFVVGAGASKPYNLPTGRELKVMAVRFLTSNEDICRLIRTSLRMKDSALDAHYLNGFREQLESHPGDSIDEFLEDRRREKDVVMVGKTVIAALVGKAIKSHREPNPYEDWLRYVVTRMRIGSDSPDTFVERNYQTRFVTFNFDTFIENKLPRFIHQTYGSPSIRTFLPVVHVHGKLEDVPMDPLVSHGYL